MWNENRMRCSRRDEVGMKRRGGVVMRKVCKRDQKYTQMKTREELANNSWGLSWFLKIISVVAVVATSPTENPHQLSV